MQASPIKREVYFKLSSFYFFFFALLGAFAPYISLYLHELNFSLYEIGLLSSILLITKVIAPNLWSWIGDHRGFRLRLVRYGAFLSIICFSGLLFSTEFWVIAVCIAGFSFFWNAILPQYEVVTLFNLGNEKHLYSVVRVWGSIGFILSVYLLGLLFEVISILWLPWFLFGLLIFIWSTSLFKLKEKEKGGYGGLKGLSELVFQPPVVAFFLFNFLLQVSHGPYYTFFSLYMEGFGYSKNLIGAMWALGVLAEVILFIFMKPLLTKFDLKKLASIALLLTSIRWLITAHFADNLVFLFFSQILHAASFGVMHIVAIHYVNIHFNGEHEGQGQALYSSASFGLGGAIGAYTSGVFAEAFSIDILFLGASALAFISFLICIRFFKLQN